MLTLFCNSCRGYLTHTIKSSHVRLRKYTAQAAPLEIPLSEIPVPKQPKALIKCKNEALNFYAGHTQNKFQPADLASKGWRHYKSIADHFTLYPEGAPHGEQSNLEVTSFEESNLDAQLLENLRFNDLIRPSRIQKISIPMLLTGKNSVIAAETGCGKTLAYLLPMLQQIIRWKPLMQRGPNEPLGLILSPSRDLTQQLGLVAKKIAVNTNIKVRVIVGGRTKQHMINPNVDDVDLLIGSFGAISKLTTTAIYKMSSVRHVVLEEADTLLDDSFIEKLRYFLKKIKFSFAGPEDLGTLPQSAQLTLVSATMPTCLPEALEEIVNIDSLVRLTTEKLHRILPQVPQKFIRMKRSSRPGEILKLVKGNLTKNHQTLIFCNTIKTCEWLYLFLGEMGIDCCCTHGNINASLRSQRFAEFQRGHYKVLATTDACSRGLDTVNVNHVVNFDFPLHIADYIHRCGRTGRLGSRGHCQVTNFVSGEREIEVVQKIERSVRESATLPNVNGNITKIIRNKINQEIHNLTGQMETASDPALFRR